MPGPIVQSVVAEVGDALGRIDLERARATYRRQNEFVALDGCLPPSLVQRFVAEVEPLRAAVHRVRVPGKKSGSVSWHTLRQHAPGIVALYRSPPLLDFLAALTGYPVQPCPDRDPHACALYWYGEPGDYITAHYDTSFYAGTLVVFDGDNLWHAVTPLGPGEERITLTMQYVTTQAMTPFKRIVSDMKDAISYFGFREVFAR